LHAGHPRIIVNKVAFKKDVDGAGYDFVRSDSRAAIMEGSLRTNHKTFHRSVGFNAGLACRTTTRVVISSRVQPAAKVRMSVGTLKAFSAKFIPERTTSAG
jgi:hypothetical protein